MNKANSLIITNGINNKDIVFENCEYLWLTDEKIKIKDIKNNKEIVIKLSINNMLYIQNELEDRI